MNNSDHDSLAASAADASNLAGLTPLTGAQRIAAALSTSQTPTPGECAIAARAELEELLTPWASSQRWCLHSDNADRATTTAHIVQATEIFRSAAGSTLFLLVDIAGRLYSVPLFLQESSDGAPKSDVPVQALGTLAVSPHSHPVRVFDATEHPDGQLALLHATLGDYGASSEHHTTEHGIFQPDPCGHPALAGQFFGVPLRLKAAELPPLARSYKLTSEQSNTSVIYEFSSGSTPAGVIVKVLRLVQPGRNPDVELEALLDQSAQSEQRVVPQQYGYATLRYSEPISENSAYRNFAHRDSVPHNSASRNFAAADVLVAAEFLAGSTDAWQLITSQLLSAAGHGTNSSADLHPELTATIASIARLGTLTRAMHQQLAEQLILLDPTDTARAAQLESWKSRAEHALVLAPELRELTPAITATFERAARAHWPLLQRIHGDYHLGQVLGTATGQWRVIDFEGEPLRPLSERIQPDLALRDVAGMLRSISYAAGFAEKNGADPREMHAWERSAHKAFLESYTPLSSDPKRAADYETVLRALVLDKALYEVAYEAAYRPSWVDIPVRGVHEILQTHLS
ncbi:MAG: hypothetical protein MR006_07060 [Arcanobacterium sp.]|nr:hypothetical protein [Arcanobacterium sp.]MDY5588801.1 hypothetical protein [Arcanobacterium sp.]